MLLANLTRGEFYNPSSEGREGMGFKVIDRGPAFVPASREFTQIPSFLTKVEGLGWVDGPATRAVIPEMPVYPPVLT